MQALTRRDDWRRRFEEAIDAIKYQPFSWERDCAVDLVGGLVQAVTGVDVAAPFRGRYKTAAGALRVMKDAGFSNVADLIATILPEIHPSQAGVGDIAAIVDDSAFGFALGVVNGERVFVLRQNGLGTIELLDAQRAFKVG